MNANDISFIKVSASSKIPNLLKIKTLLSLYILFMILCILLAFILNNKIISGISIVALFGIAIILVLLSYKFNSSPFKKLFNYIYANNLYEEKLKPGKFNNKMKVCIKNSAIFLYKYDDNQLIVRAKKNADRYSEKANSQDEMFSALFGLELIKKNDEITYCDYVFDRFSDKRLNFSERKMGMNYQIILSDKVKWTLGSPAHTIIVGGTGAGKSQLASMLVLDYLRMGSTLFIIDPKSSDLAMIGRIIGVDLKNEGENVATEINSIIKLLRLANEEMEKRYKEWFEDKKNFGKTWKDIPNALPLVVMIDEFSALSAIADTKTLKEIRSYLFNLILKGRQAGVEVVMMMQRPDANILGGSIREQFGVRVKLGNMSDEGKKMIFGSNDINLKNIKVVGAGHIQINGDLYANTPVYFEPPLLTNGMDYLDNLDLAIEENLRISKLFSQRD